MIEITTQLLDEIERKAKVATKGDWKTHLVDDTTIVATDGAEVATTCDSSHAEREDGYNVEYERMEADAAHIARMDPPTTLALVAYIREIGARETPAATVPDGAIMAPEHKLAVAALVAIRDSAGIYGVADNTAQDLIRAALEAHGEPTEDFFSPGREGWDRAEAALAAYRATKETGHG